MSATNLLKRLFFEKNIKSKDVAKVLGKPEQSFYNQLNRDTWKFKEVEDIAARYGCEIVLQDTKTGDIYKQKNP